MKNKEISISEIANIIMANNTFDGDSIVFLPIRSKKSQKDYSNLINKIGNRISADGHRVLISTEERIPRRENNTVHFCELHEFFKSSYENDEYHLKLVLSPRFDKSTISQILVRKKKKVVLIVEEFFSTEKYLSEDLKEIENLGAEVLGAIYVERY